ncbi:PPE family protein, partial [Mycobacterium haemophilum DSM 44634]
PEDNASNICGPGSEPIRAAVAAWESLARELVAKAREWKSQVSATEGLFQGEAARKFKAAARQYIDWLYDHICRAYETADSLCEAAEVYDMAVGLMVSTASILANRVAAWTMRANNVFFGQFTPRIAELDAEYQEMWATNAGVMNWYQSAIHDIIAQAKTSESIPPPPVISSARFSDVYVSENIVIHD